MALIKCTECGKDFSEKASVCPNCGCPTEMVLKEMNMSKHEEPKEIVATYDILGCKFVVDKSLDFQIRIWADFNKRKRGIRKLSEKLYYEFENIDRVIEEFPGIFSELLEGAVQGAVKLLVDNGVFDCDEQCFIKKYGDLLDASTIMEPIVAGYLEIQDLHEEIEEYHQYLRNSHRNYWQGGGFGIEGALKGHFKAQMLNAGTAFLTSLPDNKKHSQNLQEIQRAKKELYENEETKSAIVESIVKIFSICYRKAFEELEKANVLKKVSFQTDKAISVITNLLRYVEKTNGNDIDMAFCMERSIQAFTLDPTCIQVIHSLIVLWENVWDDPEEEDLVKYAQEYDFWDEFIDMRIVQFLGDYKDDYNKLKYLSYQPIESFEAYKAVVDSYFGLRSQFECYSPALDWSDANNKVHFDSCVKVALEKYLKYDKSIEDQDALLSLLEVSVDFDYSEGIVEFFREAIDELTDTKAIDYDWKKLNNLIDRICAAHSKDHNCTKEKGFYFACSYRIDRHEDFKYFKQDANLPSDCTIYLLCGKIQYGPKTSKYVVAITNYGIYIYQRGTDKVEAIQMFCSWHNFNELQFCVCPDGGIYFEGKRFEPYTWELLHILHDLKKQVNEFLKKTSKVVVDDEEDTDTASEIRIINAIYSNENLSDCRKYYKVLTYPFKSTRAKEVLQEKEQELLAHAKELNSRTKIEEIEEINISDIISAILSVLLGIWLFTRGGWLRLLWKILGILFVLGGPVVLYEEISKYKARKQFAIKNAAECEKEFKAFMEEFDALFKLVDDHITLK